MLFGKKKKDDEFEKIMEMIDQLLSQAELNTKAGLAAQESVLAATTFNLLLMTGVYDDFDSLKNLYYKRLRTVYNDNVATKLTNLFYGLLEISIEGLDVLRQIEKTLPQQNQLVLYASMLSSLIGMIRLENEAFSQLEPEGNAIGLMIKITEDAIENCNFVDDVNAIFSMAVTVYYELIK